jgi:hypothetical protein
VALASLLRGWGGGVRYCRSVRTSRMPR